jgi:hypothetical protein
MLNFFRNLMPDGLKRAIAAGLARDAMKFVAGILAAPILALAAKYGFSADLAQHINVDLVDVVGTLVLGGAGVALGIKDRTNVAGKMALTAQQAFDAGVTHGQEQGETAQVTVDQARADAVSNAIAAADAAAPKTKAALLASLP